jgi:myo-inositol-1(or 4)-monophosphatase
LNDLERRRVVAEEAARAAAVVHLAHRRTGIDFKMKNGNRRDLVTQADTEAEAAARAIIGSAFPDDEVIGEEDGSSRERIATLVGQKCWLVDPLDGTFNFVYGFPDFSATVAYVENGQPLAAATYAPILDECFTAAQGMGTTLNDDPVSVSPRRGLNDSIVNVWTGRGEDEATLARASRVRKASFSQRTFGGTALVLAYVACGRFDVFYTGENPRMGAWDIAAGALLVQEAGGVTSLGDGSPFRLPTHSMGAAADRATLDELLSLLNEPA